MVATFSLLLLLAACDDPERALPESYRRLEVPAERLASAEARERGRKLFRQSCALCHGKRADGRGVRHSALSGPPQDFTDPHWRARVTPRSVYHAIRKGKSGTSMASWGALGEEETWDLVAFLLAVSEPSYPLGRGGEQDPRVGEIPSPGRVWRERRGLQSAPRRAVVHEYFIVSSLMSQVDEIARDHGATSVERLHVRIGDLSGVEIELFETAFELFTESSICAGTTLEVHPVAARWTCSGCDREIPSGAALACPDCALSARLAEGDEIILDRIEMEVA